MSAEGPLSGRLVLVTRAREQAGELAERLRSLGADPLEAPAIAIEPARPGDALDAAIREVADRRHVWVGFTSAAGVEAWFSRAAGLGRDAADLRARVAVVGEGTARALRARGVRPDLVPETFTTAAMGRAFPEGEGSVLLPRADIAPADLEEILRDKGWTPVRVTAYRTRLAASLPREAGEALDEGRVDAVTFMSASTVRGFVRAAGLPRGPKVVCIGPVTARTALEAGLAVDAVAEPHTIEGLVEAVRRVLRPS